MCWNLVYSIVHYSLSIVMFTMKSLYEHGYFALLTAIGTIGAVVVALFKEPIVRKLSAPNLKIQIRNKEPDFGLLKVADKKISRWMRVWVSNIGKSKANNVILTLDRIEYWNKENNAYELKKDYIAMKLLWTHTNSSLMETILPGMGRYCELACIHEGTREDVLLLTESQPYSEINKLKRGTKYRLHFLLGADNAKSQSILYDIEYKEWSDNLDIMFTIEKVK